MSVSSEKGKSLEEHIAKTLRKKLGARVQRDKRSGAGSHQKMDLTDWHMDTPFDIEAKNHKTIAIKKWMRQTKAGTSPGRIPTLVFDADDDVLACIPFDDLVNLAVQIRDLTAEIDDLRSPIPASRLTYLGDQNDHGSKELVVVPNPSNALSELTKRIAISGVATCRNGHIVSPGSNRCLDKHCAFSSTYKKPKVKK
ncbi:MULTISPECIES: putative PDDEXK endonuclease [unclassified Rhodococcus (in: high G+C Gram-positive bacteria)]|uniref:putative PDDEXK endonuclease n=1 Tax=unclassified Rhodococcus (in: high G+C Gram-positive bacteria) TaxID=192944 RepID=UPI0024B86D99|nr:MULTISPECIES: hypothetical protein [unclassified Rhodococcus (in: high G+C Gram-positive bacteria)]MDI9960683.1 hypothetical protein [Rhodococcus sp. IEGM 1237]MDI9966688.1 hypothetical protein [Rhodococcus sp. IEGM 1251]MDV8129133.1 hypothetical protein [Rhodococcus sp. IEGM 1304]